MYNWLANTILPYNDKIGCVRNVEMKDTDHFMMRCAYVVKERERLENLMSSRVEG